MSEPLFHRDHDCVVCDLCFHHCRMVEGGSGFCEANANQGGELQSLVYGRAEAVHIDPIEKKPLYHFYPGSSIFSIGTVGCNFRCPFCQNWSLSFKKQAAAKPISNESLIEQVIDSGCNSIAFTYNEPTVAWIWYRDLARLAKENGVATVMVTNGAMSDQVCHEMVGLIDAVNVDLKSGFSTVYAEKLHGDQNRVLENLSILHAGSVWIELTTLVVPRCNDSILDLDKSADLVREILGISVPWHISGYHPAYTYSEPATRRTVLESFCHRLTSKGFTNIYAGNVHGATETVCRSCGSILISRHDFEIQTNITNGCCPNCGTILEGRYT